MRKIEAIIREEQLPVVMRALEDVGYPGITVTPVRGHGRQKGLTESYRGVTFTVALLPKVKIEIVVADSAVEKTVRTIADFGRTGAIGDGKIWVMPVESMVRVRTGETEEDSDVAKELVTAAA